MTKFEKKISSTAGADKQGELREWGTIKILNSLFYLHKSTEEDIYLY